MWAKDRGNLREEKIDTGQRQGIVDEYGGLSAYINDRKGGDVREDR